MNELCPICGHSMGKGLKVWHWECMVCAYEKADLVPAINETLVHQGIDERIREVGLRSLRKSNFKKLLSVIIENGISSGRLLDVGCAHGLFMQVAATKFSVFGIEPDLQVYERTARSGLPVRWGFFPQILEKNEQFDGIIFNDVFEHIPDVHGALDGCRSHLRDGGLLLLNLPSSSGIFYKTSRLLCRVSFCQIFKRLWQEGLPSPHIHYFNAKNISLLLKRNSFEVIKIGRLPSIQLKGLYSRVSYTGNQKLHVRLFFCFLITCAIPFLRMMPNDIMYIVSRKVNK